MRFVVLLLILIFIGAVAMSGGNSALLGLSSSNGNFGFNNNNSNNGLPGSIGGLGGSGSGGSGSGGSGSSGSGGSGSGGSSGGSGGSGSSSGSGGSGSGSSGGSSGNGTSGLGGIYAYNGAPINGLVVTAAPPAGNNQKNNLQLKTLAFVTSTPAPTQTTTACATDNAKKGNCTCVDYETNGVICDGTYTNSPSTCPYNLGSANITCKDGGFPCQCFRSQLQSSWGCGPTSCIYVQPSPDYPPPLGNPNYPTYSSQCSDHQICFGKPVLYFYSSKKITVSVRLDIPGHIVQSIPTYPSNGWEDITVYPGGILSYRGNTYREIYYESSVNKDFIPDNGFVFATQTLRGELNNILIKKGLTQLETNEFLNYWLPKLYALHKPYIFVGFLTPKQKEIVDNVVVQPKPDTTISFLAYFKGLSVPISIKQGVLPNPQKRNGFTMVEWGGTIGSDNN